MVWCVINGPYGLGDLYGSLIISRKKTTTTPLRGQNMTVQSGNLEYLALRVCPYSVCIVAGLGQEIWLAGSRHQWAGSPGDRPGTNQRPAACQLDPEASDPAAHSHARRPNQNPKETWTQARQQGSRPAVHQHSVVGSLWLNTALVTGERKIMRH